MSRCSCYVFTGTRSNINSIRLSHSEIPGSKRVYRSPRLIAVSHVLHRLLAPRHPLCALCSLINLIQSSARPDRKSFLITETLGLEILPSSRIFSDSALKSCIYYPVCRYQRTSGAAQLPGDKKLNFDADRDSTRVSGIHRGRDKIEFQFAVPKFARTSFSSLATHEAPRLTGWRN